MERLKIFLLLLVCSLCVVKGDINEDIANMVMSVIDWTVDPCDDFYNFSCGSWLKNTSIPDDSSRFDRSFTPISQRNEAILRTILENPNSKSKINNFYSSCMNLSMIDIIDVQPLFDYIYAIASIEDMNDVMYTAGILQSIGVNVFFNLGVDRDAKNPEMDIALFGQGGISLPDISLYDDEVLSQKYVEHITDIYNLIGLSDALTFAKLAFQFEKSLAGIMLPNNELIDPFMVYNKIDMQGLRQINDLPWDYYLLGLGAPDLELLSVDVVSFFKQLSPVVRQNPDSVLSYFMWKLVHHYSNQLSKDYVDATFNFFGKILNGQKVPLPRWRTCVSQTDDALPELTGYEFAMKAFPGESKVLAENLLENIENAMFSDISGLPWMDAQTRTKAIEKLKLIVNMIGFPNPPFNYSDFEPNPTQYLQNTLISHATTIRRKLNNVGKQSDRYTWGMSADTVNAYYEPTRNEMVFPAGILQTPFFNRSFPLPMNYGGTGMVMGHELTHAFDNQGRDYDGNGVLIDWWTNATSQKFNDKVQCVIDQYSKFEVLPNIFVDGKLTQGENIADMGGIKLSYTSYVAKDSNADQKSIVPGLTNKQLFFVSFAQNWCSLTRPSRQEILVKVDPHSPPRFRVLGPLMNLVDFSKTFNCPAGSKMNPTNRCEVW